ncbi:MAG: tRNA (N6-threonylcarbamoyladenosine(37)-N6)-methyltransferase TrmO, partial [Clostridia bacterium]|nr:tRNA (N6-threonylcarbamoyladenosine(37)-N6)-methyltransferase TrmO [Clostridia bacterium]
EYRNPDAVRGLEDYSHIWLIWEFSAVKDDGWHPTVRPPKLGGNTRIGVFATRSPFRPNSLGLSSVKLERIEIDSKLGPIIHVSGADLMDQTPIFDIKPYLPKIDCHLNAKGGFTDKIDYQLLEVSFPKSLLKAIPVEQQAPLIEVLAQDPRPSYQNDPERIYGMRFGEFDIRFTVTGKNLTVKTVEKVL